MTRANEAGGFEHEVGATDDAAESPEGDAAATKLIRLVHDTRRA